jgi:hypothetical protein
MTNVARHGSGRPIRFPAAGAAERGLILAVAGYERCSLSYPAKAGYPVRCGPSIDHRRLWNTGSPACAGDDSGGYDGQPICPSGGPSRILSIPSAKNISLVPSGKSGALSRASRAERGALANVINAARDAVDADALSDERCETRTAKSCGPDAPTLASSLRKRKAFAGDGGKKARSPGRARYKP